MNRKKRPEPMDFRSWNTEELRNELQRRLVTIRPADRTLYRMAVRRWDSVAKPLRSLGLLEEAVARTSAMTGCLCIPDSKAALVICCGDNGIVEEGVTQTGREVTAVVTASFTRGESCSSLMAEREGIDLFPLDLGVACDIEPQGEKWPLTDRKIRRGTRNFTREPAMTEQETLEALLTGIDFVRALKEDGYRMILTGEMGIGNTTTSSAVASAILKADPADITGKGAGLSEEGLKRKVETVRRGLSLHRSYYEKEGEVSGIRLLSAVGGFDLAGMAGLFLGGAVYRIPVVIDGFISAAAALAASSIVSETKDYMIASHVSGESAAAKMLDALGAEPVIRGGLSLGEGTGAICFYPMYEMARQVYEKMNTFSQIEIEDYKPL